MPAYNFQDKFANLVESGQKRQTIRPKRKRPTHPGDMLYLYTGMRTKACRLLRKDICQNVTPIIIESSVSVKLAGRYLLPTEVEYLAKKDGFAWASEMAKFFRATYGLPFDGELIEW